MTRSLRLDVPPTPRSARHVRERVVGFAQTHAVGDETTDAFVTALSEALVNAIEHSGSPEAIEVTCWLAGEQLLGSVVDRGVGFTPGTLDAPEDDLADLFAERGRGIAIMRKCTDIFAVRSSPGEGTQVVLGRTVR